MGSPSPTCRVARRSTRITRANRRSRSQWPDIAFHRLLTIKDRIKVEELLIYRLLTEMCRCGFRQDFERIGRSADWLEGWGRSSGKVELQDIESSSDR